MGSSLGKAILMCSDCDKKPVDEQRNEIKVLTKKIIDI